MNVMLVWVNKSCKGEIIEVFISNVSVTEGATTKLEGETTMLVTLVTTWGVPQTLGFKEITLVFNNPRVMLEARILRGNVETKEVLLLLRIRADCPQ